ncbi:MAG: hypothetical protein ACRDF4_07920 [Rhabdochlamydiaceae bacterium]
MKTLNSVHSRGMTAAIGGTGVLAIAAILLLSFAPFFSFAAGTTVAVQTSASSYPAPPGGGEKIPINGTVSPAPGATGYSISLTVTNAAGLYFVASTPVNGTTGAFSYTLVTGTTNGLWDNGTYTVTGIYSTNINSPTVTGSTTFAYGTFTTTSTSSSSSSSSSSCGCGTTVVTTIDSITTVYAGTTTVVNSGTTTVINSGTTTVVNSGTTVTQITTVSAGGNSSLGEALGAVGVVVALIAGGLAALALRKH